MTRNTSSDTTTNDMIKRYVPILSLLSGWGTLSDGSKAVYPQLGLPAPQEPFPCVYVYLFGQTYDFSQGTGYRRDITTIAVRIIGGPVTPRFRIAPEIAVYALLTGVLNELTYRRFLEDPTNNDAPFTPIEADGKLSLEPTGSIRAFSYQGQGEYVGIEVHTKATLLIHVGRIG